MDIRRASPSIAFESPSHKIDDRASQPDVEEAEGSLRRSPPNRAEIEPSDLWSLKVSGRSTSHRGLERTGRRLLSKRPWIRDRISGIFRVNSLLVALRVLSRSRTAPKTPAVSMRAKINNPRAIAHDLHHSGKFIAVGERDGRHELGYGRNAGMHPSPNEQIAAANDRLDLAVVEMLVKEDDTFSVFGLQLGKQLAIQCDFALFAFRATIHVRHQEHSSLYLVRSGS